MAPELEQSYDKPPTEPTDFYNDTTFWRSLRRYGFRNLVGTLGSACALAAGGAIVFLYLHGDLKAEGLKALSVAYVSLAAALFGIVLAGLAVVAAFFDRQYVRELRQRGSLQQALFVFWWVAMLAVISLFASVGMIVALFAGAARAIVSVTSGLATVLFVSALCESLALVGTMMRHGLYRAELEIRASRNPPGAGDEL